MLRKGAGWLLVVDELGDGRMVSAYRTIRISRRQLDRAEVSLERIEREEPSCQKLTYATYIYFMASSASRHPMTPAMAPMAPACLQVDTASFGGMSWKTHR